MSRSTLIPSLLVCAGALLAAPAPAQTVNGLVAAYGFEEGSGTAIGDASGRNNNGVASGTSWSTAGKFGNALVFNGTNARVTVPNTASLQLTTAMTLEAWVLPTTAPTGWRAIVDKTVDGYYLMASTDNGNRPGVGGTWNDGNKNIFGPTVLPVNTWSHLATTFDGTTVRFFVNGVQVSSQAQTAALGTTTGTLQIGGDSYPNEFFAGLIDEVRVYNRALSAAEIQADMGVAVGTPPPPVVDTVAPSAPPTLSATAASATQINLSWTAATDNVGVTGYRVERCLGDACTAFTQIFTLSGTTFNNTGLTASTSYSYRVRAVDAAGNLGAYSVVASATTPAAPDTTAPSAPASLSANPTSSTQIDLVWVPSTDNVGVTGYQVLRCQGASCTTFAQVGTSATPGFSNTGLTPSTTYRYSVRAVDAAGNVSANSNTVNATTPAAPDTTPPGVPGGLAAVAASQTQISLSWAAATDNVGVTGYQLERCSGSGCSAFAQIAAPTGTSFNDTGLTAATSYSYRVRAIDAAGNVGGYSLVASATTPTPDVTPPTTPTGLTTSVISASQVNLNWNASTDNVAVTGYELQRCQGIGCTTLVQIAAPTGTNYSDTGLTGSTTYRYWVRATDAAGNLSPWSSIVTVTTPAPNTAGLVAAYGFDEGTGTAIRDASGQNNNGVASGTTWAAGKFGNALVFNGTNAQVTVPNAASLQLTTGMTLEAWVFPTTTPTGWRAVVDKNVDGYYLMASTDNGNLPGVGGNWTNGNRNVFGPSVIPANAWTHLATTFDGSTIRLFVNGVQVASVAQTAPLAPTTATLQIGADAYVGENFAGLIDEVRIYNRALDAAEIQVDMATSVASVTPPPAGDTTPPSAPGTLTVTASGSTQINLAWGAATDDVGVTGYRVERCAGAGCSTFAQIATPTATSFSDTGLTAGTSYSYQVRATDAAGNLGPYSVVASGVTLALPDTTPPSAPGGLAAVATSQTQISVSWTAATDNVGVIGYQLERCSGSGCATFAQIAAPSATSFNDTGLTASTSYSYRARAVDGAGNLGGYSAVASATTLASDLTAPTTPTGLTATAASASQVNLSWTASTDNVAVTGYILQRCLGAGCSAWVTIATPTGTTYSDTGLSATTTYRYWVRATDAAGNLSAFSSIVTVTTLTPDTSGLVAAYGFDEGSGTTIRDASGQNNNGVATATTWTAGKFGNALVFNGTSSQVTIPDAPSLRLTTAMTLEAWVFPTSTPTGWRAIVDKNIDGYYLMASTDNGNRPAGGGTWTSGNQNTFGPAAIPVNSWTHLATTFDGATIRLFVNGVQVASVAQTAPLSPTADTLQIGADFYPTEYFAGLIDEVRIYNRALSPAEIQVDMLTAVAGAAPPPQSDTTPPSVNITSPANGATVTNTVSVAANATDDVGVASVQFLLDGSPLGSPVNLAPFSVAWDTATAIAGSHVLQARATDFAGNSTTSVSVSVSVGTPTGSTAGQWAAPVAWPIVAVHANLLATGEILAWDGQDFGNQARLWNPATGVFTSVPNSLTNMFCGGHCLLPDGRALVAGGHLGAHVGLADTNLFDPTTRTWSRVAPMAVGRWYPTVTALPDGRMLVTAGEIDCGGCVATIPEVFDPHFASWTQLTGASQSFPYYPHMFVLGDGRVLAAATTEAPIVSRVLDISTQTWSVVDPNAVDGGSSVMYAPGKIMKSGRSVDPDQPVIPSTATTFVLDMNQPAPTWRSTAPMNFARTFHTLTLLPDGSVLATGGGPNTDALGVDNAVLAAELWSPVTETWTTLASMQRPRLYHSNALLLPDARVLALGGGRFNGGDAPTDQKSSEIFSPPYLFRGARPVISSAPSTAAYGTGISVQTPDAASIGSVVLMKLGTVTHSFNTNQRIVPLAFTAGAGTLSLQTPANANLAPPGHYMLFILNTNGVPSVASIVQLQ
jgi:chitodextrinase